MFQGRCSYALLFLRGACHLGLHRATECPSELLGQEAGLSSDLGASFLQKQLAFEEVLVEEGEGGRGGTGADTFTWRQLMSPADCVVGKNASEAQKCHLRNLETLVSGYFSKLPENSVTQVMLEHDVQKAAEADYNCCIVQVINNTVWDLGCSGTHMEQTVALLKHATSLPDVGTLPDVEMVGCTGDHVAKLLPAIGFQTPFLAPVAIPESRGLAVPVHMFEPHGSDSWESVRDSAQLAAQSMNWKPRGTLGNYSSICEGRKAYDSTQWARQIAGESKCLPFSATKWSSKKHVAFFRGGHEADCACQCRTPDNLCYDCTSDCKSNNHGLPCAVAYERGGCLRHLLVEALQVDRLFDVGGIEGFTPECEWELNKYLLVIGHHLGWADRLMESLMKSSATILVDTGVYEWFYPLLIDDVHIFRSGSTVESVIETAKAAMGKDDADMVQRANSFAQLAFDLDNVARYSALVAKAYSKVLAYSPKKRAANDPVLKYIKPQYSDFSTEIQVKEACQL